MNRFFLHALLMLILCVCSYAQTALNTTVTIPLAGSSLITLQGQVPCGNTMSFTLLSGAALGDVTLFNSANGTLVYTPKFSFGGATDTLNFTVTASPLGPVSGSCPANDTPLTSASGTVTLILSPDKTFIEHTFLRPDGAPRTGTASFVLTEQAQSGALVSVGSAVTVTLDSLGRAAVSLYPSETLTPTSYYAVYLRDANGKQESYGLYNVKAAPSGTIASLGSSFVVDVGRDSNLKARYTFASQSAVEGLINLVRSYTVQNNGTTVGARPTINLIAGSGLAQTMTDNSGANRIDVTLSCPSCPGGSSALATGTINTLAYYSATNTVSSYPTPPNRFYGTNAAGTAVETKQILGGSGITVTHGVGNLTISYSGATNITSLNGLTAATQSLSITNSGCTFPAWSVGASTHYLCLPHASTSNSLGLVSNGTQSFGGNKSFQYVKSDTFATLEGSAVATQINSYGMAGIRASFGRGASLTPSPTSTWGFALADTGNDDSINNVEEYLHIPLTSGGVSRANHFLSGSYFSTTAVTGALSALRALGNYTGNATVSSFSTYDGLLEKTGVGSYTRGQVYRGSLSVPVGLVTHGAVFYAADGYKDPAATVTNAYGLYVENTTYGTNNYAIYTADNGTGGAGAPVSIGSALELRGMGSGGILPAGTDNGSFIYNADTNNFQLSYEGNAFQNLAGFGTKVTKNVTGSVSLNLDEASLFDCTLTGNVTQVTATNLRAGSKVQIIFRQNAAGNLTLNESSSVFHFAGGTNPGISLGSNVKDLWDCVSTGTNLLCTVTYDVR